MRVVVLQPGYLPWLGFFDQMARSDVFVLYDDVQFDKHGWRNRNRVKTANGPCWLTVPVHHAGFPTIHEVRIDNARPWGKKHLETLRQSYRKAPFFDAVYPLLEPVLSGTWGHLVDLDLALIDALAGALGLSRRICRSSQLQEIQPENGNGAGGHEATGRLVDICCHFGADRYLTGDAARDYLDVAPFEAAGIAVEWQEYRHPQYSQLHGDFVSHLSVVDLLFNHGPQSLSILCGDRMAVYKGEPS